MYNHRIFEQKTANIVFAWRTGVNKSDGQTILVFKRIVLNFLDESGLSVTAKRCLEIGKSHSLPINTDKALSRDFRHKSSLPA